MLGFERLTARNKNGLAYLVNVKPNEQEVDSPHKNTLKCILDCFERLAQYEEEAIARQSVKSEEIQEAINWITKTGHSNQYMSGEWTAPMKNHITQKIQETILTALQQYQPVAITKTETTSCEWCEIASACEYEVTFFRDDDRWATQRSLMPKYCPYCGQKIDWEDKA